MRRLTSATLYATDANPLPIRWLKRNLPFANYGVNRLLPPLKYADRSFDFVYALSIFTHLDADSQRAWLAEMARVLRPGGCFFFTTHGAGFHTDLAVEHRPALAAAGFLPLRNAPEGCNPWATFQTPEYTAGILPPALELIRFEPGRPESAQRQDAYIVRKRG